MAEKEEVYSWDKGLWVDQVKDYIPEGCCTDISNFVYTPRKTLIPRADFIKYGNSTGTFTSITNALVVTSRKYWPDWNEAGGLTGAIYHHKLGDTTTLGRACVIVTNKAVGLTQSMFYKGSTDSSFTLSVDTYSAALATYFSRGLAQYRDRVYGTGYTGTVIQHHSYTNLFTGAAVVKTSTIVSTAGLVHTDVIVCMASYKDRIWAVPETAPYRIYYTEVAAAGGYPENWNSGNNFVDVADRFGKISIKKMHSFGNKLYLFSDSGVFVLYAEGPVSSWSLQPVSLDMRVFSYDSSIQIDNTIVYTDRKAIYQFDGTSNKKLSLPIEDVFKDNNTCRLFEFENGIMAQFCNVGTVNIGGGIICYTFTACTHYYFDGEVWVKFDIDADYTGNLPGPVCFYRNISLDPKVTPHLVSVMVAQNNGSMFYYNGARFKGDDNYNGTVVANDYSVTTRYQGEPFYRLKRSKLGYLQALIKNGHTLYSKVFRSGGTAPTAEANVVSTTEDDVSVKFIADGYYRKAALQFYYTSDTSYAENDPPVELKNAVLTIEDIEPTFDKVTQ
jgi:hypothetical protein